MPRTVDFVDHDYDRRLEEFKARRDQAKKKLAEEENGSRNR